MHRYTLFAVLILLGVGCTSAPRYTWKQVEPLQQDSKDTSKGSRIIHVDMRIDSTEAFPDRYPIKEEKPQEPDIAWRDISPSIEQIAPEPVKREKKPDSAKPGFEHSLIDDAFDWVSEGGLKQTFLDVYYWFRNVIACL